MKIRWVFKILIIAMSMNMLMACAKNESLEDLSDSFITEEVDNESLKLIKYVGVGTDVIVPEEIEGKVIVTIASKAFANTGVEKITFGPNVTTTEYGVFQDCPNLTSIIFLAETLPQIDDMVLDENQLAGGCTIYLKENVYNQLMKSVEPLVSAMELDDLEEINKASSEIRKVVSYYWIGYSVERFYSHEKIVDHIIN